MYMNKYGEIRVTEHSSVVETRHGKMVVEKGVLVEHIDSGQLVHSFVPTGDEFGILSQYNTDGIPLYVGRAYKRGTKCFKKHGTTELFRDDYTIYLTYRHNILTKLVMYNGKKLVCNWLRSRKEPIRIYHKNGKLHVELRNYSYLENFIKNFLRGKLAYHQFMCITIKNKDGSYFYKVTNNLGDHVFIESQEYVVQERGVRIPIKYFKEEICYRDIIFEQGEVRSWLIRRVGHQKLLEMARDEGAKVELLDTYEEQELFRITQDGVVLAFANVKCPSTGEYYWLRVDPEDKDVEIARLRTFGQIRRLLDDRVITTRNDQKFKELEIVYET